MSPTRCIKTHHITTSNITPPTPHNFNPTDFNHYPFLTYIFSTYIIVTEIIIIFNCYRVTETQLTTYTSLYSYNNTTLKMVAKAAETC